MSHGKFLFVGVLLLLGSLFALPSHAQAAAGATIRTNWNASTPNAATGGYKVYVKGDGATTPVLVAQVPAGTLQYDYQANGIGSHTIIVCISGINTTGQESALSCGNSVPYTNNEPTPTPPTGVSSAAL